MHKRVHKQHVREFPLFQIRDKGDSMSLHWSFLSEMLKSHEHAYLTVENFSQEQNGSSQPLYSPPMNHTNYNPHPLHLWSSEAILLFYTVKDETKQSGLYMQAQLHMWTTLKYSTELWNINAPSWIMHPLIHEYTCK